MTREELIKALAEYFDVDEDIDSYDWRSGCSMGNGVWLTLANVVYALEDYLD